MSSLMGLPVCYVLTHDSIGVGEDGPTHQPIEQLTGLRTIPGLKVFRPADYNETVAAYEYWVTKKAPVALALSRQDLPQLDNSNKNGLKGGYVVSKQKGEMPAVILIATGSEVSLAMEAQKELATKEIDASVVSMPCVELFEEQSDAYKQSVLPSQVRQRVAIEAGHTCGWYKYVGLDGAVIGVDTFGLSGKPEAVYDRVGVTLQKVVEAAQKVCK